MRRNAQRARALLTQIDPGRLRRGWPIGLRDGAILALLATDLTAAEIAVLPATAITVDRGALRVTLQRGDDPWSMPLRPSAAAPVLAWLTDRRLWATPQLLFTSVRGGPITHNAIYQIFHRYQALFTPGRKRNP